MGKILKFAQIQKFSCTDLESTDCRPLSCRVARVSTGRNKFLTCLSRYMWISGILIPQVEREPIDPRWAASISFWRVKLIGNLPNTFSDPRPHCRRSQSKTMRNCQTDLMCNFPNNMPTYHHVFSSVRSSVAEKSN